MAKAWQHPQIRFFLASLTLGLVALSAVTAECADAANPPAVFKSTTPAAMAAAAIDVDATFELVARYQYGSPRKPLADLEQLVRYASSLGEGKAERPFLEKGRVPFSRRGLADRMASFLRSDGPTPAAKEFVARQLGVIGTSEQAPALAAVLADKELAPAALGGLSQIPGPAVDRILRDALGKLQGDLKLGTIRALGQRCDRAAAESLIALLAGADEATACAAANALGEIGGEAAFAALEKSLVTAKGRLRAEVVDACLACAEKCLAQNNGARAAALYARLSRPGETPQVRMAALRGTVLSSPETAATAVCEALAHGDTALQSMAIQLVPEIRGPSATEQLAQCLGKLSPPVETLLIEALAARPGVSARSAIEAAVSSGDPAVRLAALKALGTCGNETSVKVLVNRTSVGAAAERDAVRSSLVRLRGARVNDTLAGMISKQDSRGKVELIRALADRSAVSATDTLQQATEDPDGVVRKEAWKALGGLARAHHVVFLLDRIVRTRDEDRDNAEKAVAAVLNRAERPDVRAVLDKLETALTPPARAALVRIASAVADDRGLTALRKAVRSDDAVVRDAAVRGLAAWPTPAALDDLVSLARHAREPVHRVLALRGAIRLSSKAGHTPEQTTRLVAGLMPLAVDPAERKAVLAELGRCATLEALRLAQERLADPELATEAGVAVTQIASVLREAHRDEALAAIRPLLTGERDPVVTGGAWKVLRDILKPVNLAIGAKATNPDGLAADGAAGGPGAAIDDNPDTYWDETDGADLYRLKVTLRQPAEVSSINILWHPHEQYQAKNFDILCDGKVVQKVRGAKCFENEMFLAFAPVRCGSVELVIPGKNGLVSPCIHELRIYSQFPPETTATHAAGLKDTEA